MMKVNEVFIIYIEEIKDGAYKGYFLNPYIQEQVGFSDLSDMVLKINCILRKTLSKEHSREPICYQPLIELTFRNRTKYFFLLEIFYLQHSSWQGRLTGTGCQKICFKSVLDLLEKINQGILLNLKSKTS